MQPPDATPGQPGPWLWRAATVFLCLVTTATSVAAKPSAEDADGSLFDVIFGRSGEFCDDNAVCLNRNKCDANSACGELQDCFNGTCGCRYPLPEDYVCYSRTYSGEPVQRTCDSGRMCSIKRDFIELMPLALTTGVCFVVAVTAMLACKMLIKRMHAGNPATRLGDGDTDSVSSMQRWINERQRDRPPRYEEMVSQTATASHSPSGPSGPSSTPPQTAATTGPGTISAAVAEAEKPPAYAVVVNDTPTSGIYYQGPIADNIPPPLYSAEAVADVAGNGPRCYRNPCFLRDEEDPPPYSISSIASISSISSIPARNTRSVSLPDPICTSLFDPFEPAMEPEDFSFTDSSSSASSMASTAIATSPSSPTSSLASFASASSSSLPLPPTHAGVDLLTVSQAVALKEMMLAEGVPAATVERSGHWTSTC